MKKLLTGLLLTTFALVGVSQNLDPKAESAKARQEAWAKAQKQKAADQAKVAKQRRQEAKRDAALDKLNADVDAKTKKGKK